MELNLQFILKSLAYEPSWKAGDRVSFSFDNWNLTLKRVEEKYSPFTFSLFGEKVNSQETWSRRYVSMEQAYLHILNRFNENGAMENKYKSLDDIVNRFSHDKIHTDASNQNHSMDLKTFLSYFDFDYGIVSPGGKYEDRIRQELIEDEKLTASDADKDLICLIDCQGAYFGDIDKERYPISADSIDKIIDRMNIYINEFEEEFQEALEQRDIDPAPLSFEDMVLECMALGVGDGEVCYSLAEVLIDSESIFIKEVAEKEKDVPKKISLDDQILGADLQRDEPFALSLPITNEEGHLLYEVSCSIKAGWLMDYFELDSFTDLEALWDISEAFDGDLFRDALEEPAASDIQVYALVKDNVKVEWDSIGEGLHGDYNPRDPEDIELLRFYVSVLRDGIWEEKEDGSYCTNFPVESSVDEKFGGLVILLNRFHDALSSDIEVSVKKLGEELSWIAQKDVNKTNTKVIDKKTKPSLEEQVRAASNKAKDSHSVANVFVKESSPER